jgi:hypothetical protein
MLYGDLEQVKGMLRPSETAGFGGDAEARLAALQEVVSLLIEEKTGRVFGGTATPTARTIEGPRGAPWDILLLPSPIRSVTSVAIVGSDPVTLDAGDYVLWNVSPQGDAFQLRRVANGYWPIRNGVDRIVVTGVWSDTASGGTVPADIDYIANYIIAERFKSEKASPAGFTGPDGATVPVKDPWRDGMVKAVVEKYAGAKRAVTF